MVAMFEMRNHTVAAAVHQGEHMLEVLVSGIG